MTPAQLRDRMISALGPACFAGGGCAVASRTFTVYDDKSPTYLFNMGCFCRCEPREVVDVMARRARRRRH